MRTSENGILLVAGILCPLVVLSAPHSAVVRRGWRLLVRVHDRALARPGARAPLPHDPVTAPAAAG